MNLPVTVSNCCKDILHRKHTVAAVLLTLLQHWDTLSLSGAVTMRLQLLLRQSGACPGHVFKAGCPFRVPADVKVPLRLPAAGGARQVRPEARFKI